MKAEASMNKAEFINLIEDIMEEDSGTFKGPEMLADFGWDSIAVMSLIAKVDESLNMTLGPAKIAECKTVDDLVSLVEDKLT